MTQISIYRCSVSNVSRAKGSSAVATLSYITGQRIRDERTGRLCDYGRKQRVVCTGTLLPDGAPPEFADPGVLFNALEAYEHAANARPAKKILVALPREMDEAARRDAVEEYIRSQLIPLGCCTTYAIHTDEDDRNPHAHILVSNRRMNAEGKWQTKCRKDYLRDSHGERVPLIDPETGQQKLDARNRKQWKRVNVQVNPLDRRETLMELRKAWANVCNARLPKNLQIDHRSLKDQGIDRIPQIKEGYAARRREERGLVSERCAENRVIREINAAAAEQSAAENEIRTETRSLKILLAELGRRIRERIRAAFNRIRDLTPRMGDLVTGNRVEREFTAALEIAERAERESAAARGKSETTLSESGAARRAAEHDRRTHEMERAEREGQSGVTTTSATPSIRKERENQQLPFQIPVQQSIPADTERYRPKVWTTDIEAADTEFKRREQTRAGKNPAQQTGRQRLTHKGTAQPETEVRNEENPLRAFAARVRRGAAAVFECAAGTAQRIRRVIDEAIGKICRPEDRRRNSSFTGQDRRVDKGEHVADRGAEQDFPSAAGGADSIARSLYDAVRDYKEHPPERSAAVSESAGRSAGVAPGTERLVSFPALYAAGEHALQTKAGVALYISTAVKYFDHGSLSIMALTGASVLHAQPLVRTYRLEGGSLAAQDIPAEFGPSILPDPDVAKAVAEVLHKKLMYYSIDRTIGRLALAIAESIVAGETLIPADIDFSQLTASQMTEAFEAARKAFSDEKIRQKKQQEKRNEELHEAPAREIKPEVKQKTKGKGWER